MPKEIVNLVTCKDGELIVNYDNFLTSESIISSITSVLNKAMIKVDKVSYYGYMRFSITVIADSYYNGNEPFIYKVLDAFKFSIWHKHISSDVVIYKIVNVGNDYKYVQATDIAKMKVRRLVTLANENVQIAYNKISQKELEKTGLYKLKKAKIDAIDKKYRELRVAMDDLKNMRDQINGEISKLKSENMIEYNKKAADRIRKIEEIADRWLKQFMIE